MIKMAFLFSFCVILINFLIIMILQIENRAIGLYNQLNTQIYFIIYFYK